MQNQSKSSKTSKLKDPVTQEEKRKVIYNIQCKICTSHYVGQITRRLAECTHEHQLAEDLISQQMDRFSHNFNCKTEHPIPS